MFYKNRGMLLESIINKSIVTYKENNIGIFHKKELPITFSKIKDEDGKLKIDNGFIKNKSTADYYGIYKGRFVAFEAKSTKLDYLPISNIKDHQYYYLRDISFHGGICFLIIFLSAKNEFYAIDVNKINISGTRITREELKEDGILLELTYPGIIDFAYAIDKMK